MEHFQQKANELPPMTVHILRNSFDAHKELRTIRAVLPGEEQLSVQEKRKLQKERLAVYKEALSLQEEVLGDIVYTLRDMIEENPDRVLDELVGAVNELAEQGRLTLAQIILFTKVCTEYDAKHSVVKKYVEEYSTKPAELFEQCFHVKPHGRIDLMVRPLALLFVVYDEEDYIKGYAHDEVTDTGSLPNDVRKNAKESGGCFFNDDKAIYIPELKKRVGLIKGQSGDDKKQEKREARSVTTSNEIKFHSGLTFSFKNSEAIMLTSRPRLFVSIDVRKGENAGHIGSHVIVQQNYQTIVELEGVRMKKIDGNDEWALARDKALLAECWRIVRHPDKEMEGQVVSQTSFSLKTPSRVTAPVPEEGEYIAFSVIGTSISMMSEIQETIHLTHRYTIPERTAGLTSQETIALHEEEHGWNALFSPVEYLDFDARLEAHIDELEALEQTQEKSSNIKRSEKARIRKEIVKDFIRHSRRNIGIDSSARDELLAYWKDGRSSFVIEGLLTDWIQSTPTKKEEKKNKVKDEKKEKPSDLYNYRKKYKEEILKIPSRFSIIRLFHDSNRYLRKKQAGYHPKLEQVLESLFPVNPSWREFRSVIKEVFEKEYAALIKKSCKVLLTVLRKGYSQDEACALLASVPLSGWSGFERRLAIKPEVLD